MKLFFRTMRCGLGLPANTISGIEPRGDMDVMLSMRAQGFISSPPLSPRQLYTPPQSPTPDQNYAASVSSHRSQATRSKSISTGPVSTFKGLLSAATRPRAGSRAATITSERPRHDQELHEESSGSQLNDNVRSSHSAANSIATPIISPSNLSFSDPIEHSEHRLRLERKILPDQSALWALAEPVPIAKDRANRSLSLGALSLQPPPRKRWTSVSPTSSSMDPAIYEHMNGISSQTVNLSNGTFEKDSEQFASPGMTSFSPSSSEQTPRAPSIQSVSTMGSGEITFSTERSSSSTKHSSTNRWSRQGILPRRLTPPIGPPPSVPSSQPSSSRTISHPYAVNGDRPSSRTSSIHSTGSQKSIVSNLPSFSKRASGSSAFSFTTSHSSQSNSSRPASIHINRCSMPPPRPAPTSSLPPAPDQDIPISDPGPMSKSSFRDSVTNRAFRLSMIAPKPPPSSVLPPRPDEPEFRSHRRNSSTGSYSLPSHSDLPTIPQALAISPFPPPRRPVPPTPISALPMPTTPPPRPVSRTSIKQRLRILSAPSPPALATYEMSNGYLPLTPPVSGYASEGSISPLATPIARKIMAYPNEPSFLQIQTPITPILPPPAEQLPELTSLSPPPRRGSKQIVLDSEAPPVVEDDKAPAEGEHKHLSLSRPGSVISLAIVSM